MAEVGAPDKIEEVEVDDVVTHMEKIEAQVI